MHTEDVRAAARTTTTPPSSSTAFRARGTRGALEESAPGLATALVPMASVTAAVLAMAYSIVHHVHGMTSLALYGAGVALTVAGALFLRHRLRAPRDDDGSVRLDVYELAYLAGGARHAVAAAVAELDEKDALYDPMKVDATTSELARAVSISANGSSLDWSLFRRLTALAPMIAVRDTLTRLRLILDDDEAARLRRLSALVIMSGVLLAIPKMIAGTVDHRPVGFLFLAVVAGSVAVALTHKKRDLVRTRAGDAVLARLRAAPIAHVSREVADAALGGPALLPLSFAALFLAPSATSSWALGSNGSGCGSTFSSCGGGGSSCGGSSCGGGGGCGGGGCGGGGCGG